MDIPKLVTIKEAAELSKDLNIGISKNHIRNLVKRGEIKHIMAGTKTLIVWNNLLEYLSDPPNKTAFNTPGIRPVAKRYIG
ncbi:MAG: helix-turn-helix domain-containing protein [Eubacteriales bacterium]